MDTVGVVVVCVNIGVDNIAVTDIMRHQCGLL